jgi:hypothetical protein
MHGLSSGEKDYSSSVISRQPAFFSGQSPQAVPQPVAVAEEPHEELLTAAQITSARAHMRNTYSRESITLLRSRFGLSEGNQVDNDLVLAVAQYQDTNGLVVDGKLGETTFETIQAEGGEVMQDVVMFRVMSPLLGRMSQTGGPGLTNFLGQFNIEIHLPPGEDCGDYEYRQFICGRVEMLPVGASPAGPLTDLRSLFNVPGGLQPIPNYTQDGNTTLTPQRMGHRSGPGSTSPLNHYVNADGSENQRNGCIYKGEDFPGITGRITNTGEQYEFDFRFMGQVRHKDRGVIATRFWSVRDDFVIF